MKYIIGEQRTSEYHYFATVDYYYYNHNVIVKK